MNLTKSDFSIERRQCNTYTYIIYIYVYSYSQYNITNNLYFISSNQRIMRFGISNYVIISVHTMYEVYVSMGTATLIILIQHNHWICTLLYHGNILYYTLHCQILDHVGVISHYNIISQVPRATIITYRWPVSMLRYTFQKDVSNARWGDMISSFIPEHSRNIVLRFIGAVFSIFQTSAKDVMTSWHGPLWGESIDYWILLLTHWGNVSFAQTLRYIESYFKYMPLYHQSDFVDEMDWLAETKHWLTAILVSIGYSYRRYVQWRGEIGINICVILSAIWGHSNSNPFVVHVFIVISLTYRCMTHSDLVTSKWSWSTLVQTMACCLTIYFIYLFTPSKWGTVHKKNIKVYMSI